MASLPADIKRFHVWTSEQPCSVCGTSPVQVCHYTGMDGHMLGKGRGRKAHHMMVFPACQSCHSLVKKLLHSSGVQTYIGMNIISAYENGVIKL